MDVAVQLRLLFAFVTVKKEQIEENGLKEPMAAVIAKAKDERRDEWVRFPFLQTLEEHFARF